MWKISGQGFKEVHKQASKKVLCILTDKGKTDVIIRED